MTLRPTWMEVRLDNVRANYRAIMKHIRPGGCEGPGPRVFGVIKANAYNLGAVQVAWALKQEGADYFIVATADEAMELRAGGVTDAILMLEHSVYSVISPEGCAAILWKDQAKAREAAEAMRMTAADCKALGIADEVIPEPPGGAHSDPVATIDAVGQALVRQLDRLAAIPVDALLEARYAKFRRMGAWEGSAASR